MILVSCTNEDSKPNKSVQLTTEPIKETIMNVEKNKIENEIVIGQSQHEELKKITVTEKNKDTEEDSRFISTNSKEKFDTHPSEEFNKEEPNEIDESKNIIVKKIEKQNSQFLNVEDEQKSEFLDKSKKLSKDFDGVFNELDEE